MGLPQSSVKAGQIFGDWTVLGPSTLKTKSKSRRFICKCKCGIIRDVSVSSLTLGISKSCGCSSGKGRRISKNRRGPPGEASLNVLEGSCRNGAADRKLEFSLTKEQYRDIISRDCHYCGEPPHLFNLYVRAGWGLKAPVYKGFAKVTKESIDNQWVKVNGIDRVDNNRGYTLENSVPCCFRCNICKMNGSLEEFLGHAVKIAKKSGKI